MSYASPGVELIAEPAADLQSIEIKPDPAVLVGTGDSRRLSVIGQFADGIPREISPAQIIFSSSDPGTVSVDAAGMIISHGIGQVMVEAAFQALSASRTVKVLPPAPLIFADNFESGDLTWWSTSKP